jgi:nitrite reductase/ring-hydroxylating ferredoxin subunit
MKKVRIGTVDDFPQGKIRIVRAESVMVVVNHTPDGFYAVENRCPHWGFPIGLGQVEGDIITCPFHGSKFDMRTGQNLDWVPGLVGIKMPNWSRQLLMMGKQPTNIQTFEVSQEGDSLYVSI